MNYLGIDIGGTGIKIGMYDDNLARLGDLITIATPKTNAEDIMQAILTSAQLLVDKYGVDKIGVCAPGKVSSKDGTIVYSANLPFSNTNVRDILHEAFGVPVMVENDANAAAFGEHIASHNDKDKLTVTIMVGTGIGSGVVQGGDIIRGRDYRGGELGHIAIRKNGKLCACGKRGCMECYASATALHRLAKELAAKHPLSILARELKADDSNIALFKAYDEGSKTAKLVLKEYATYLADGINVVITMLDPDAIYIGGGIMARADVILPMVNKLIGQDSIVISVAKLRGEAGAYGAAAVAKYL